MMNLAIDIGNSFTHMALFDKKKVVKKLSFESGLGMNLIDGKVKSSLGSYMDKIGQVGLSSVVPLSNSLWNDAAIILFKLTPITINFKMQLPIKIKVKNPQSLGTDRICNAAFAFEYFKRKENAIIADFGTANTYDVILKNGDFIGGIIAPGISTSAKALSMNTGQLPLFEFADLKSKSLCWEGIPIRQSSPTAELPCFATEGIIKGIEKEFKRKFKVIITGGSAKKIQNMFAIKTYYAENAVLEGINIILNYNSAK
jgi:type III pantothenate kinase